MSKLEELLQKLCPNGIEYKKLGNAISIERGKRLVREQLVIDGKYPVFQNSLTPLGYHTNCNYPADTVYMIGAGAAGEIGFSSVDFWAADDCYPLVCGDDISSKYLYHVLLRLQPKIKSRVRKASIPRISRDSIAQLKIPVPPLEVQREIVRVLDSFTLLTAELTAELTARKKQYEFYRNKLLSFDTRDSENSEFAWKTLGQLGKWSGGKTPSMAENSYWEGGTIPWISSKDMKSSTLLDTEDHITEKAIREISMTVYPRNSIAVVTRSGILKHTFPVAYVPFETTINQDIKMLVVDEGILPRYAFHLIQGKGKDILAKTKKQGGTVDSLDFQKVLNYRVPVPSLAVQERLVKVLDNFDAICNDLNIGLPAEIVARQKQYECYRDSLLTFAETGSIIPAEQSRAEQSRAEQSRAERAEQSRAG
ncbi:restriction endonuclease subunit S, partial [Firmicutes bacterium AF25-13AC]